MPKRGVPELTYIVSAFDRPMMLPVCLLSIAGQSHKDFHVYVADNAVDDEFAAQHCSAVDYVSSLPEMDGKFTYIRTARKKIKVSDAYWAAEWIVKNRPIGRWLCFPCDDTYLFPEYAQRLLTEAARRMADFVWSRWAVVGPHAGAGHGVTIPPAGYAVWDIQKHRTIKTTFLVKRSAFEAVKGFSSKPQHEGYCNADYYFSTQMVNAGIPVACLEDLLLTHN